MYRTEAQLWQDLVRIAGREYVQRIEVRFPDGLPDVLVNLGVGRALWIELKICRRLREPGSRLWFAPTLELEQAIWLGAWRRSGGACGVLIADGDELGWVTDDFRELRTTGAIVSWSGTMPTDRARLFQSLDQLHASRP